MPHLNLYPISQKNEQRVDPPNEMKNFKMKIAPEAHHSKCLRQFGIRYIGISASIAIRFVTCRVHFVANSQLDLIL